jgi:hypothetical protein
MKLGDLMHSTIITPTGEYELVELQGYYYSNRVKDLHCQRHKKQKTNGQFYIHRGKMQTLKEGTLKALDITFGNGSSIYFGITIRSVYDVLKRKMIEGSSVVVSQFMDDCECSSITELASIIENRNIHDITNRVLLCPSNKSIKHITFSPRILQQKHGDPRWLFKSWRATVKGIKYRRQSFTISPNNVTSSNLSIAYKKYVDLFGDPTFKVRFIQA